MTFSDIPMKTPCYDVPDVPMKTHGIFMLRCPSEDAWYIHATMSLWRRMVYPCYDVPMKTHGISMLWCPYEDAWYIHAMMSLWRRMVYPCYDVPMKTHGISMLRCPCEDAWYNHVAMPQRCPVTIRLPRGRRKEDVMSNSFQLPPLMKWVEELPLQT